MPHTFNFMATGIGSLPLTDPDSAAALSLKYLAEAPIWPQLPKRDFRELMAEQYSEMLPGIRLDEAKRHFYFDTAADLTPELEVFFQQYLDKNYGFFKITELYAAGFYALVRALQRSCPPGIRFIKGHITGPLTAGVSFKDSNGRDIIHNETVYDALVKGLAMKAAWQIRELTRFNRPVIIFIDEPAMESLGSAFSAVSSETVAEKLNEIIDTIHEMGGLAGIHCCGNADWPMLFNTRVDIVNFDAFGYMEKVLLYPGDLKKFYGRGGTLAWGIVPTGDFTGKETSGGLISKLEEGFRRIEPAGVSPDILHRQCILTPACGMGSLSPEKAEAILKLLKEVSYSMKKKYAMG